MIFRRDRNRTGADPGAAEMIGEIRRLERLHARRRFDAVIARVAELLPIASAAGLAREASALHRQRGLAYFNREVGVRGDNLDAALEDLEAALALATENDDAADVLMHAGLVAGEDTRGDVSVRSEHAVELLVSATGFLTESSPGELVAIVSTNLARALLLRERGDRAENLRRAVELCETALDYRSPERDAVDWAFTQVNLADIMLERFLLGEVELDEAAKPAKEVIRARHRIRTAWLVGAAYLSLGRLHARAAFPIVERLIDAESDEDRARLLDGRPHLESARRGLQAAIPPLRRTPDRTSLGHALVELAEVLLELGDDHGAIAAAHQALNELDGQVHAYRYWRAAAVLGHAHAGRAEWQAAAGAYRIAIHAAEPHVQGRFETRAREREIRRLGNLARWAAFALGQAGAVDEAVTVLEAGLTRELRRRVGANDARLSELPNELSEEYEAARASLAAAPLGRAGAAAERRMQEVLAMIRGIPGLADIATFVDMDEISQAAEPDIPLVYVNPTPLGTQLLTVSVAGTTHTVLDEPTSRQVFLRLAAGDDAAPLHAHLFDEQEVSYFYALGETSSNDFYLALDDALPWLGERLARPINDAVAGSHSATLIPCGPVRALPLHAAPWIEEGAWRYLVDSVAVRYAASATMTAASLRRKADSPRRAPALLALADPRGDLPAARAEIEEIARNFGDSVAARTGLHATFDFVKRYVGEATHIHLACHAEEGFFDAADAGVEFADRVAPIYDLTQLKCEAARLVVVSACESALGSVNQLPAEAFSVSTAFWLAGTACAIASLWQVDDFATAMLMTRFYEELMSNELPPPEALRRAQLWLRDLDGQAEAGFLKSHPELEAEYLRRESGPQIEHPYAHEEFWAPFIAIGA